MKRRIVFLIAMVFSIVSINGYEYSDPDWILVSQYTPSSNSEAGTEEYYDQWDGDSYCKKYIRVCDKENKYCMYCSKPKYKYVRKLQDQQSTTTYKTGKKTEYSEDECPCPKCHNETYPCRGKDGKRHKKHKFKTQTIQSTCENSGYEKKYCVRCGVVDANNVLNAKGHDYKKKSKDIGVHSDSVCYKREITTICKRCGKVKDQSVQDFPHDFEIIDVETDAPSSCKNPTIMYSKRCRECLTKVNGPERYGPHNWVEQDRYGEGEGIPDEIIKKCINGFTCIGGNAHAHIHYVCSNDEKHHYIECMVKPINPIFHCDYEDQDGNSTHISTEQHKIGEKLSMSCLEPSYEYYECDVEESDGTHCGRIMESFFGFGKHKWKVIQEQEQSSGGQVVETAVIVICKHHPEQRHVIGSVSWEWGISDRAKIKEKIGQVKDLVLAARKWIEEN